jgi:hypothetical protein
MRKALLSFALAAAFVTSPAFAQEGVGPSGGDWELQLAGSGSNDNDFSQSNFSADISLGYYLDRNWMVGVRQDASFSDAGGSNWTGSTRVNADYHFDMGEFRPFLGANIGYVYGDGVNDTWTAAPEGGVKWYVKPETFLFGRAEYQWFFDEGEDADDTFDDGRFIYTVGVGFNF